MCYKQIPIIYRTSLLQNSLKVIINMNRFVTQYITIFLLRSYNHLVISKLCIVYKPIPIIYRTSLLQNSLKVSIIKLLSLTINYRNQKLTVAYTKVLQSPLFCTNSSQFIVSTSIWSRSMIILSYYQVKDLATEVCIDKAVRYAATRRMQPWRDFFFTRHLGSVMQHTIHPTGAVSWRFCWETRGPLSWQ